MKVELSYLGRSQISSAADGLHVSFAPNLARGRVFFDGQVENPIRYREAMSALHDVVISDLRFKKRSGSDAYKQWLADQKSREQDIRRQEYARVKEASLAEGPAGKPPPELEKKFRDAHQKYWRARRAWADELARNDPELWRALVPCDPVITVAPDVVFFEGFAKDESAYGCLLVDRNAFSGSSVEELGTTNVDYSLALYSSIQTLRSYRTTRLSVDPTGFEVKVSGHEDYREEKIDLPPSWLRAFGQITASMMLPSQTVTLDRGTVYAVLSFLKRNREKKGPRSILFELEPGKPPRLVLEPWGIPIVADTAPWSGEKASIKMWGRRRLFALARLLPLAEKIEVRLLGSGLPSLWTVHMGEMRFILGLSGWTTNDWASAGALDLLAGLETPDPLLAARLGTHLHKVRSAKVEELAAAMGQDRGKVYSALHLLSKQGQAIFDFAHGLYRYRPILPVALSEELIGPEHPELRGAKELLAKKEVRVERDEVAGKLRIIVGRAGDRKQVEVGLDADGVIKRGQCDCSHFFKSKLRKGPCRHILALRLFALSPPEPARWKLWN